MASNPFNLVLRFVLELAAWAAMGYWGWTQHTGPWRFVWAIGLPLVAMALWGVFRVPGDGGPPVVDVPGWARLLLEVVEFGGAVWLLSEAGRRRWAIILAVLLVFHYAVSFDRVRWLLSGGPPDSPPTGI